MIELNLILIVNNTHQNHVWEESGKVHHFARALNTLAETEENNFPCHKEKYRHGRSDRSSLLDSAADPQDIIAERAEKFSPYISCPFQLASLTATRRNLRQN